MRKQLGTFALITAIASIGGLSTAQAVESKAGGVEFSGNVDVLVGYQHDDSDAIGGTSCAGVLGCNAVDANGSGTGQLGDLRGASASNRDTFNFYLDQVELDIQKSFGENIRLRADLDFGRALSGSGRNTGGSNFNLEQGYVTANLPVGNGMEFLIGRFNAPIGLESVDRPDNIALSFSNIFRFVRPHNVTGAKIYYPFSDSMDLSLYVVNNLADVISFAAGTDSAIPSYGLRFGFTWGEESKKSTLGISYAGGPEQGTNDHLTHILDVDFMVHLNENFAIGGEGIYRQDNIAVPGAPNSKALGGMLLLAYTSSETWNFDFRYGYLHDVNPTGAYTGRDQQIHDFTLGTGYQITDDAKMKLEYRLDLHLPEVGSNSVSHGIGAEFAYNF